ncbi:MAG: DUF2007 domain-containing protein [bacterium]
MRDICVPSDAAEAEMLESLLKEHGIEALVLSHHDTAFDGIYQAAKGWGRIRVRAQDASAAKALIEQWRSAEPVLPRKQRYSDE